MDNFLGVDWRALLYPSVPLAEIFIRGSVMYIGLFVLLRFVLKREAGTVSVTDLLVVVLLADAAQNAMAGSYTSITGGLLLVAVIIFWSYTLNWLGYRFSALERLVYPRPLLLVENGEILWQNMRRELITYEELLTQLRHRGIEELSEVKAVYIEGDGRMSIVKKDSAGDETEVETEQDAVH